MKNQNRGITLVALVVTIIVMLILISVAITLVVKGGIIQYAKKAVEENNNAIEIEQTLANGKVEINGVWYNSIDDYFAGKPLLEDGGEEIVKGDVKLSYTLEEIEDKMQINFQVQLLGIPEYNETSLENEFIQNKFLKNKTTEELMVILGTLATSGTEMTAQDVYNNFLKPELGKTYEEFMKDKDAIIHEKYGVESADLYAKTTILNIIEEKLEMNVGALILYSEKILPELVGMNEPTIKTIVEEYLNNEYTFDEVVSELYGEGLTLDMLESQIDGACYGTELFTREEIMIVIAARVYALLNRIEYEFPYMREFDSIEWYCSPNLTHTLIRIVPKQEGEYILKVTAPSGNTKEIVAILKLN